MSDNWVVGNLQNALDTWNAKVTELWSLILTDPKNFKGGGIWTAISNVNTAMQAIGTGLLVLFFVIGFVVYEYNYMRHVPTQFLKHSNSFQVVRTVITWDE